MNDTSKHQNYFIASPFYVNHFNIGTEVYKFCADFVFLQLTTPWKCILCLTKHHATKTYGGEEVYTHTFLTSALCGGLVVSFTPRRFTSGERIAG